MILSVAYDEIVSMVREKSGRTIGISGKDADTVTLSYEAEIPIPIINRPLTKTVSVDLHVEEFAPPRAIISLDAGVAGNMALDMASKKILERLPAGLVESLSGGRAVLNLDSVPQLQALFQRIKVNDLSFYGSSLAIDFSLKQ